MREKHWLVAFLYALGIEPATWVCALTGNQTHNISIYRTMLQTTEPHWPGSRYFPITLGVLLNTFRWTYAKYRPKCPQSFLNEAKVSSTSTKKKLKHNKYKNQTESYANSLSSPKKEMGCLTPRNLSSHGTLNHFLMEVRQTDTSLDTSHLATLTSILASDSLSVRICHWIIL